jgi:hypothetical protein
MKAIGLGVALAVGSAAGGSQSALRVDSVPALDIAGSAPTGAVLFGRAAGATRLSSGVIVIADPDGPLIRYFDAKGAPIRSVGGRGAGPGEFRSLSWMGRCHQDTLFVYFFGQQQMTVVAPNGTFTRRYELTGNPSAYVECSRNGHFGSLGRPETPRQPGDRPGVVRAAFVISDVRNAATGSIPDVPAFEFMANAGLCYPGPLGPRARFALSHDRVFIGIGDSVQMYGLDGRRMGLVRIGMPKRKPEPVHQERGAELLADLMSNTTTRSTIKQMCLREPVPEFLPVYSALLTDPRGLLWAVVSNPGDRDTKLRALDTTGRVAGDIRLPMDATIFEIGEDYILAGYADARDEPHVALFRLRRA